MSAVLPRESTLGSLRIDTVYEYYDRPVLFSCSNASGARFLAVLVERGDGSDLWLYASISSARLRAVEAGAVDLHDAFALPEDGQALLVSVVRADSSTESVTPVAASDLEDRYLPSRGERLSAETGQVTELTERAVAERRFLAELSLEFPYRRPGEAPAEALGQIIGALQTTISAIVGALGGEAQPRGPLSGRTVERSQMLVVAVGSSSFRLNLAGTREPDLFGWSPLEPAFDELSQLVSAGSHREMLTSHLARLRVRVAARYANLLRALSDSDATAEIAWANPMGKPGRPVYMDARTASAAIGIIEDFSEQSSEIQDVIGTLTGAMLRTGRFELQALGRRYQGEVLPDAMGVLKSATLSREYVATIRKSIVARGPVSGVETRYQLLGLKPYRWEK